MIAFVVITVMTVVIIIVIMVIMSEVTFFASANKTDLILVIA